jgi:hypothetical protein
MVVSMYRTDLPEWVMNNMKMLCPYCGAFLVDNSDTGVTTARWCCNPKCPGHMMHKAKVLGDYFGVKGFGPRTALGIIKAKRFQSHFDFIPHWFGDKKPLASLPDIATLCCIEDYGQTTANKELGHYSSFEEYFSTCLYPNQLLVEHKDELLYGEKLFTIKPPVSARKMYVMGTGSFHGYNSRDDFFRLINDAYGMYINVIQTGKRKTGISYLIKEYDAVDHSKSRIAREYGIPVVTPAEFLSIIEGKCAYLPED